MSGHPYRTEIIGGYAPLFVLVLTAVLIAAHALLRRDAEPRFHRLTALVGLVLAAATIFFEAYRTRFSDTGVFVTAGDPSRLATGSTVVDRLTLFAGIVICVVAVLAIVFSTSVAELNRHNSAVFHATVLLAAASGYAAVSQHDMATLFPAITALAVCAMVLAALSKTRARSVEAAFEGAIVTGVILATLGFGMALIYGVSGTGDLSALGPVFAHAHITAIVGVALVMLALLSLAGGLPWQRWFVDVGGGVPAPIAGAILALVTVPVSVTLLRIAGDSWGDSIWWWRGVAGATVSLTAIYSGLMASRQTSLRRLAAYTVSGQIAVTLGGVVALGPGIDGNGAGGGAALLFDLCVIVAALLAVTSMIGVIEDAGIADSIKSVTGLAHRTGPWGGFAIVGVVSLTALPPLGLFAGHLMVWEAMMSAGQAWVVMFLAIAAALLAIPPLRLVAALLAEPESPVDVHVSLGGAARAAFVLCCVAPLLATMIIEPLMLLTTSATSAL